MSVAAHATNGGRQIRQVAPEKLIATCNGPPARTVRRRRTGRPAVGFSGTEAGHDKENGGPGPHVSTLSKPCGFPQEAHRLGQAGNFTPVLAWHR
jgi:hypothetical protein